MTIIPIYSVCFGLCFFRFLVSSSFVLLYSHDNVVCCMDLSGRMVTDLNFSSLYEARTWST